MAVTEIQKLTKIVEKGFAAMADEFAENDKRFRAIDRRFDSIEVTLKDIKDEVRDIRKRLDTLEKEMANVRGFSKEIDYLLSRVANIEKHLGIA